MLIEAPISRFTTTTSPFASSSFFFLNVLQWRFERVFRTTLWTPHTFSARFILPLKPKTQQKPKHNCMENEGSQKTEASVQENRHHDPWQPPRSVAATTAWPWLPPQFRVSPTVKPWWPLAGRVRSVLVRRVLPLCLDSRVCALGHPEWAFLAWLQPLLLKLHIKSHIPHKSWPETLKSTRKLNKAKTERNRRNCG